VFVERAPFRSATSDVKAKASASLHGEVTKQTTWLKMKMNDQVRAAAIRLGPRVTVGLPFSEASRDRRGFEQHPQPRQHLAHRGLSYSHPLRGTRADRMIDQEYRLLALQASPLGTEQVSVFRRRSASRQQRPFVSSCISDPAAHARLTKQHQARLLPTALGLVMSVAA